jgi:hypothetical protein
MGYRHKQFDDITLIVWHYRWKWSIDVQEPTFLWPDFITEWKWR